MELTGGRGLYGRGSRPAHLPPGPLPGSLYRNPESYEHDAESSNADQTADTDEQSPGDVPQSNNIGQAPLIQAQGPQTYTPGSHPQDLASQQDELQASNTYQSSVPNENEQTIDEVKQRLEDTLSRNGIQGLPPLEECRELKFGRHINTGKASGDRYLNQRLYLGSMDHSGQRGRVYMYLVDGKMKYAVEVEIGNHPPARSLLDERKTWNEVDLVEPIRTSRMNMPPNTRNYRPYEMLARYYFILHYCKLREADFSDRGKWLMPNDFARYLKTACNNLTKPGKRQAKSRNNSVRRGRKSSTKKKGDKTSAREDSSESEHDRLSDENFPSPRKEPPPRRKSTRRSTTIEPQQQDISNIAYESLSTNQLRHLIFSATAVLEQRESTPGLGSRSSDTASQRAETEPAALQERFGDQDGLQEPSPESGRTSMHAPPHEQFADGGDPEGPGQETRHAFMHTAVQGRFGDQGDFEEPGPDYPSTYDRPF